MNTNQPIIEGWGGTRLAMDADPTQIDRSIPEEFLEVIAGAVGLGVGHIQVSPEPGDTDPTDAYGAGPREMELILTPRSLNRQMKASERYGKEVASAQRVMIYSSPLQPLTLTAYGSPAIKDALESAGLTGDEGSWNDVTAEQALAVTRSILSVPTGNEDLDAEDDEALKDAREGYKLYAPVFLEAVRAGWPCVELSSGNLVTGAGVRLSIEDWNWYFNLEDHPSHRSTGAELNERQAWFSTEDFDGDEEFHVFYLSEQEMYQVKEDQMRAEVRKFIDLGPTWPRDLIVQQSLDDEPDSDQVRWA